MAQHSGFFNAIVTDGVADRKYNAKDYNSNLGAIISNGVRRSGDDDLKVTAGSGMLVNVAVGRAWIDGAWFYNDSIQAFTVPEANLQLNRIDRIVVRYDNTTAVRAITIEYVSGTPASSPVATSPVRTDDIKELVLCDIYVGAGRTSISQSNITDRREDTSLCGWVHSPVGYDDYFASLDSRSDDHLAGIDEQWQDMKDAWASVTLYKQYINRTVTSASGTIFSIGISQYDYTSTDILNVYVNGIRKLKDSDYTLNADGTQVVFTETIQAGQVLIFEVYRSIDSTGLGSVADSVATLEQQVADLQIIDGYTYVCNGLTDNVEISKIVNEWQTGGTDYGCLKLNVYGTFGATAPFSGDGLSSNRYKWIQAGQASSVNRKVILDFSGCGQLSFPVTGGSENIIFYGQDVHVIGASVIVSNTETGTKVDVFSSTTGVIKCVDSRFYITVNAESCIARTGNFHNCRASVAVSAGNSYCFNVTASGLLRLEAGEFYAFGASGYQGYVINNSAGGVAIAYGINCPTSARSGYVQTGAVYATSALTSLTDTITALSISNANGNNRGHLNASLPSRM